MKRAAAAEIGLRNEGRNAAAVVVPEPIQLRFVGRQINRLLAASDIDALLAREAHEPHSRIAFRIGFAARNRAGQSLFAVKAKTRAEDDVLTLAAVQSGP